MKARDINYFMGEAIKEAYKGIKKGDGGPFGAVIVKEDEETGLYYIVGKGHNKVLKNNDATCHGEMMAIRDASKNLKTFDLSDCILFTTGQCCTGCLCFSLWANIEHIYYACTIEDNAIIGFRDEKFDNIFEGRDKLGNYEEMVCHEEGLKLFEDYKNMEHNIY